MTVFFRILFQTNKNARIHRDEMVLYKQGVQGERKKKAREKGSMRREREAVRGMMTRSCGHIQFTVRAKNGHCRGRSVSRSRTISSSSALGGSTQPWGTTHGNMVPSLAARLIQAIRIQGELSVDLLSDFFSCDQLNYGLLFKESRRKQLTGRPRTRQPVRHFRRKVVAIPMKTIFCGRGKSGQKAWR